MSGIITTERFPQALADYTAKYGKRNLFFKHIVANSKVVLRKKRDYIVAINALVYPLSTHSGYAEYEFEYVLTLDPIAGDAESGYNDVHERSFVFRDKMFIKCDTELLLSDAPYEEKKKQVLEKAKEMYPDEKEFCLQDIDTGIDVLDLWIIQLINTQFVKLPTDLETWDETKV